MSFIDYEYKRSTLSILKNGIKSCLYKIITKNSMPLFLRGRDLISIYPNISGVHEDVVTNTIKYLATSGYNNFLIDIGANIGLTSCQTGELFEEIHMFEPNPCCYKIAEVNMEISLPNKNYEIYPYGLGQSNGLFNLTVPKNNWGGAFIKDNLNSYNDQNIVNKDGYKYFNDSNYFNVNIRIESAENELSKILLSLEKKKRYKGVIKIDVEGYELIIIKELAKAITKNIKLFIIFESWNDNLDISEITSLFSGRATIKKINCYPEFNGKWSKIRKVLFLLFNRKITSKLMNPEEDTVGDLVIIID